MRYILGISAFYHDSAAVLLREGQVLAAAQEERFSRRKNDESFPCAAIAYCLQRGGISSGQLDAVVFYEKPIPKFARTLETFLATAPKGITAFLQVMPAWLSERLDLRRTIRSEIKGLSAQCPLLFTEHHQAHAASAFYPSPFSEAAILTIDGVGEWATTTVSQGRGNEIEVLKELRFPHSLGLLYSAFTAYCGFGVNSGEYKLMGLAPYGRPVYQDAIYENLIDLKPDGSFRLNLAYFDFLTGKRMTNERFHRLFGGQPRKPDTALEQRHLDVARSVQAVTEEVILRLARHAREITGFRQLCLAGGVALNCVANGRILEEKRFDQVWIQPAAGDAGGALGAALAAWHQQESSSRSCGEDKMHGALLGPDYSDSEIEASLRAHGAQYDRLEDTVLLARTVELLKAEKVVGWFQGQMEFGPRALGNRSILGDPRSPKMQSLINLKVKFRESFRPFAPAVLAERAGDYFDLEQPSPYMLLVAPVKQAVRLSVQTEYSGLARIKEVRSRIPAVTHVDYSCRVQTVSARNNPRFHALLKHFERQTGCPLLINTSFNVRGEPIVCSPEDAYRCFVNTAMDYLVIGNFILDRQKQPREKPTPNFEATPD